MEPEIRNRHSFREKQKVSDKGQRRNIIPTEILQQHHTMGERVPTNQRLRLPNHMKKKHKDTADMTII